MKRRHILKCVPVAMSSLGGCSVLKSEDTATLVTVPYVEFTNHSEKHRTIHVRLYRNEQTILDTRIGLHPYATDENNVVKQGRKRLTATWSSEPSKYTVDTKLMNESNWLTTAVGEGRSGCCAIRISVNDNGGITVYSGSIPEELCSEDDET